MADFTHVVSSSEDVRTFVLEFFCSRFDLDPRFFHVRSLPLNRRGRQTGTYFVVEGPRRIRFTAIWDREQQTVLFYGLNGQRIQTTELIYCSQQLARAA
jgi:hypothetical protein